MRDANAAQKTKNNPQRSTGLNRGSSRLAFQLCRSWRSGLLGRDRGRGRCAAAPRRSSRGWRRLSPTCAPAKPRRGRVVVAAGRARGAACSCRRNRGILDDGDDTDDIEGARCGSVAQRCRRVSVDHIYARRFEGPVFLTKTEIKNYFIHSKFIYFVSTIDTPPNVDDRIHTNVSYKYSCMKKSSLVVYL